MDDVPLRHNPKNGVTAGVWRRGEAVHKVLTHRSGVAGGWASSDEPRHWNYWRREALVYTTQLPQRLGLGAPRLLAARHTVDGDVELELERVEGRHAGDLTISDLEAAAETLGRAQGRAELPTDAWLSRGFLRGYGASKPVEWALLTDDAAWQRPLIAEHFDPALRSAMVAIHDSKRELLDLLDRLPRTVCHLDVWPCNLFRRPDGEVVLVDWAFAGDGAMGEDISNLIVDSVFDLHFPHHLVDELDERLTGAYLRGVRAAGWDGDERLIRLGICASTVKYDWLVAFCLAHAIIDTHLAYGVAADSAELYRARGAGLGLCARWLQEARTLATTLPSSLP